MLGYILIVYLEHMEVEELYNTEGINVANMPSEQNQQLMNAVLDGIIVWLQLNENFGVGDILIDLDPMEETISANVDFTN